MNNINYKNLPLVTFQYPDSESDDLIIRDVRVIEMNATHVIGYEIFREPSQTQPKYKKYKLSRIANVQLVTFEAP